MKVYVSATKEAAAMGGALLAMFAFWKSSDNEYGSFEEMMAMIGTEGLGMKCVAEPQKKVAQAYEGLVEAYTACEEQVVRAWATKGL